MALWVKALVAKPDGQLYPVSQICTVEERPTPASCPVAQTLGVEPCTNTHTQNTCNYKEKQISRHLYGVGENICQIIADHRVDTRIQPNPAGQQWLTSP